jgi:16S rRNA (guanine(966)-N(2))-methyltransferase RsmD
MLQVLTGTIKGRKLKVPKGRAIRPTTSRIKKSIFDTLGDLYGLSVLDIFAGSGGLGIESLSRGASHVTFIEKDPNVFKLLRDNVGSCGFLDKADLICDDYERATKRLEKEGSKFDIVFIDPPYRLYEKKENLEFINLVTKCVDYGSIIIIEHEQNLTDEANGYSRITRSFGGTKVSYFRRIS